MERLTKSLKKTYDTLFNRPRNVWKGTEVDRQRPNPHPVSPAKEKFRAADEIAKISSKQEALSAIHDVEVRLYAGYDYEIPQLEIVKQGAIEKARNFGATEEEILDAQQRGKMDGAQVFNWTERP